MLIKFSQINHWLSYSVRRQLLDEDLKKAAPCIEGCVLEIGNGRRPRRGRFEPPFWRAKSWIYFDLNLACQPHICGDMHNISFKGDTFDTILCLEVLEYVTQPQVAIGELKRVLKSDGHLILSIPFLHRFDTAHDFWRISDHALRFILEKSGLSVVEIFKQGGALAVVANIFKYIVYCLPIYRLKIVIAWLIYLPLQLILSLDRVFLKFLPVLSTFSLGYLVIAKNDKFNRIKVLGKGG